MHRTKPKVKKKAKAKSWLGWHFAEENECLWYGDGKKIIVGKSHSVDCEPVFCESGLHASKTVLEALQYASGPILYRVRLSGKIVHGDDQSCATKRSYIAKINADSLLREFGRKCALRVIDLWNCPRVVKDYLETSDETLRAVAGNAGWAVARAVAGDAAWVAATAAAGDAGLAAAWVAARAAQSKMLDSMVFAAMKKHKTKRR